MTSLLGNVLNLYVQPTNPVQTVSLSHCVDYTENGSSFITSMTNECLRPFVWQQKKRESCNVIRFPVTPFEMQSGTDD